MRLDTSQLVAGDVLPAAAGITLPRDCIVLNGTDLRVAPPAPSTGGSAAAVTTDPISPNARDRLPSGTVVLSGTGLLRVVDDGAADGTASKCCA